LLAVEEPELYLHPHGRRVISNRLSKFVDDGNNQVILTTHSTEFLSNVHETKNIIAVRKNNTATTAKNIHFDLPKRKQILIKKQNAEMFFADAVILSEGADKYFIEESARSFGREVKLIDEEGELVTLGENWINDFNVSIINCGGKTELWKYAEILNELNIPFVATADFDFLRDGLSNYFTNLKFPKNYLDQLNAIKSQISANNNIGKYKSLEELNGTHLIIDIKEYLLKLREKGIFIFSGELEGFYKVMPHFDKEAGVIETLGMLIENSKHINEYINTDEYYSLLLDFVLTNWTLREYAQ